MSGILGNILNTSAGTVEKSWSTLPRPVSYRCTFCQPINGAVFGLFGTTLYKTVDYGTNWTTVRSGCANFVALSDFIVLVVYGSSVFRGVYVQNIWSWTTVITNSSIQFTGISASPDTTHVAVYGEYDSGSDTYQSRVYISSDSGVSFTNTYSGVEGTMNTAWQTLNVDNSGNVIWFDPNQNRLMRNSTEISTISSISSLLDISRGSSLFLVASLYFSSPSDSCKIYVSEDNGSTWTLKYSTSASIGIKVAACNATSFYALQPNNYISLFTNSGDSSTTVSTLNKSWTSLSYTPDVLLANADYIYKYS